MWGMYVLVVVAAVARAGSRGNENIDSLLSDLGQFEDYVTCFLDKAPCTEEAASLKKDIPATVLYGCEKCTPEQKHIVNVFISGFKKMPEYFEPFKDKYDPERKYLEKLEATVAGF